MATSTKVAGKMCSKGKCTVCNKNVAEYRCPRCDTRTCSLPCVKKHKVDRDCSGVRDKAAFVSKSDFGEMHLLNDYRFLEECGRLVNNAERNREPRSDNIPYWTRRLGMECAKREIDLKITPSKSTKRKKNTTKYVNVKKKIFWHLEWKFLQMAESIHDTTVPEDSPLRESLRKIVESTRKLKAFLTAFDDICVLMKLEKKRSKIYSVLDLDKTLCENLKGKTVIEYPTFIVIFRKELENFKTDNTASELMSIKSKPSTDDEEVEENPYPISDLSDDEMYTKNVTQNT